MISTYKHNNLTWIDLELPTTEEVKSLMNKYSLHPLVAEELLKPTLRPKVDINKETIYLILHFPIYNNTKREYQNCEIDFILGKNFLITVHYCSILPLFELAKIFEAEGMLGEKTLSRSSGVLFFHVIRQLYLFSENQLGIIQTKIDDISNRMFEKKSTLYDLVRKISHTRIEILNFQRIIKFHKEVFGSLEFIALKKYGNDFSHYLNNINGEYLKLWNLVEMYRINIESLQQTIDSLLSHRANDIMKVLTIMAFVTFPLMLITSMFGMNTSWLPVVGIKGDFWIIIGVMATCTFSMFIFFKRKKWL
ncbi:magnesium transporter CorA family protein [Patescibacteria group bacterium]|nr:magnesium transporter CorA family protein [Patescibacteria group bacterium]